MAQGPKGVKSCRRCGGPRDVKRRPHRGRRWLGRWSARRSVPVVDLARTGETTMERVAGPVVTRHIVRRHVADATRTGEAAVKRVAPELWPAVGSDIRTGSGLAPGTDADDRRGNDGQDDDREDAETRC